MCIMKRISLKIQNNDQSMIIPIKGIGNLLGYDDDVSAALTNETESSINEGNDSETRRILPEGNRSITFEFWNGSGYVNLVAPLELTGSTAFNTAGAKNSFYIIQLFDSFRDEIQSKKHTGYYNGFDFAKTNLNSIYSYNGDFEFTNLYVSQFLLDSMSGLTTSFYLKFLFYCAKSGKFYSFFNQNAPTVTTQEKLYYKINIDPNSLRYSFDPDYSNLILRELRNPAYETFVNNTIQSIPIEKPVYPTGNTFNNSGNYVQI